MADSSGKVWSSPSAEWLATWVGRKNAEIAATKARPPLLPSMPAAPADRSAAVLNYGLSRDKFPAVATGRREWYGGNASDLVGDDPEKPATGADRPAVHLTILGDPGERSAAIRQLTENLELAATISKFGDRLAVQDYAADDPMVAGLKLADGGRPDVVIQDAGGKVLYRAHEFNSAFVNAALAGEIRRVDPNYDPKKDPDGKDPIFGLFDFVTNYKLFDLSSISASIGGGKDQLLWVAIGVLALLLLVPKGQSQ